MRASPSGSRSRWCVQQAVGIGGEGGEGLRLECVPVNGKEVVVEDVDQHRAGMAETGVQAPAAGAAVRAGGGQAVDGAVQAQTGDDAGRVAVIERPLDEIPHQPPQPQLRVGAGEVEVDKVIHGPPGSGPENLACAG